MLTKNIFFNKGLINGSRGLVVNFVDNLPVVKFING